jgi:dolichol-phosphate mannosyltransferase
MADAPYDTKYFPVILKKLREGYDIVQTSRFFKSSKIVGYPFKKKVCNWLCNNFIKIAFCEFRLKDFSSLFKGFNKKRIELLNLTANEFDLGLEIVLKAMRNKYSIVEVPVDWKERELGESKLKLSKYAKHYFMRVMKIWLSYIK